MTIVHVITRLAMELFRLHAYSVTPSRTNEQATAPDGGAVRVNASIKAILDDNVSAASFSTQPTVAFVVDVESRTCDVRDHVMKFAFGESAAARTAALAMALRLGQSMDGRSTRALFIPVAYQKEDKRKVILWIFPSEDALQLNRTADGAAIEILRNVFSQRSKLRKAAQFEGRDARVDFLNGRVLDFQAGNTISSVADFWVQRFLQCTLAIKGDAGSRMLAHVIRRAYEKTDDLDEQEQLHAATIAVRRSPNRRVSVQSFADQYLEGALKARFLASSSNPEARVTYFEFHREAFDSILHFRVFQLVGGVYVSAPLQSVGQSVRLEGTARKTLVCEGTVVDEKLRASHA